MSYGSGTNRISPWSRSSTNSHSSTSQIYQNIGAISYPINKGTYSSNNYGSNYHPITPTSKSSSFHQSSPTSKSYKMFNGYVTKLYESGGVIDNEIQFSFNVCTKGIPKQNDYVTVDAIHSPNSSYKWKATKVMVINGRESTTNSKSENDYKRVRALDRSRERSRERRHEESDRKRFKRDDKDDKLRDEKNIHREREKLRDYDRSPPRRSRTPKRRLIRYAVKVPNDLLNIPDADTITLKRRYPALYVPSDFFSSSFCWTESFPLTKPYNLDKACSFHIMHKECDSYVENNSVYSPSDLNYIFSAKVMLMSIPRLEEVYKKTVCFAEDLHKEDDKVYSHLSRLIQFLVGSRGKNEPLAIGGPWSPSLDGEHPESDPTVLIKTAIRTCKALTGIDLSGCSQWYRFMEVYYHRSECVHKEKTIPARVETVVFFLPEVWNCVPTCLEWDTVIQNYKNLVEEKLQPKVVDDSANQSSLSSLPSFPSDQAEDSDKEEDLVVIDKCEEKVEVTHYSELDPQKMKVSDLRQELEARSLSTKGLKPQLIQRLTLALKKEHDREEEAKVAKKTTSQEKKSSDHEISSKVDEEMKVVDKLKVADDVKKDGLLNDDTKLSEKENGETKSTDVLDRATLEKRYALPETPHIIVHPSKTAKGGKFECSVMSLANLLDYRANDNKEHSFELFLFAELFHEMLQRDFGFTIYKALCRAKERPKEEKEEKDQKKENRNSPLKNVKEEKDENYTQEDKSEAEKVVKKEPSTEENENDIKSADQKITNDTKSEETKKKERVKMVTKDPQLLLSFSFFDRTHCNYIFDKDIETILICLGLRLSRHQIRKLIGKVTVKETFHYRKLTDKPEFSEEAEMFAEDDADLALGNKKYLPIFRNNVKEGVETPRTRNYANAKADDVSVPKSSGLVSVDGTVVDVDAITSKLKKSEIARLEVEKNLQKYKKDSDAMKESLKRLSEKEKKTNEDLKVCRDKLMSANKEKISLMGKSRSYYKLLMNFKEQICGIEEKPEKTTKTAKTGDKNSSKGKKDAGDENQLNDKEKEKVNTISDPEKKDETASEPNEEETMTEVNSVTNGENLDADDVSSSALLEESMEAET